MGKLKKFNPWLSLQFRASNYNLEWSRYPGSALTLTNGFVVGAWQLGNNYRGSGLYGAYPPQYLARMESLFPDKPRVLHLFSGSLPRSKKYTTFDIQGKPSVRGNAHALEAYFDSGVFDVVYADPPYSALDAEKYGTPMPNRRIVMQQVSRVLRPGGFCVWLDTVWPMVRKDLLVLVGAIHILRSQNHRLRGALLFRKPI